MIQATGVGACLVWSFGVGFAILWCVNRCVPLGVTAEEECTARTVLVELLDAMETQRQSGDFSRPVASEPHTEVGLIASQYNRVLSKLGDETEKREDAYAEMGLMNTELIRARDDALAGARAKSAFLATMSHEIRTPMNGTLGMIELLLDTPMSPGQRELAKTAWRSCDSLLTTLNDVLDLSRIEAGKLSIAVEDFDLRAIVDDVIKLFSGRCGAQAIEFDTVIHPAVPRTVAGDPGRVRQVLANIIGNAVKFTEQGAVLQQVHTGEPGGEVICAKDAESPRAHPNCFPVRVLPESVKVSP